MKVLITRGVGYGPGAVEAMLNKMGIGFTPTDNPLAFIAEMTESQVAEFRRRYFQPHGVVVIEEKHESPLPRPSLNAASVVLEIAEISKAMVHEAFDRGFADAKGDRTADAAVAENDTCWDQKILSVILAIDPTIPEELLNPTITKIMRGDAYRKGYDRGLAEQMDTIPQYPAKRRRHR